MAQYKYTATSKSGKTVSGSAESKDKESLIINLRKKGLTPFVIKEQGSKSKFFENFGKSKKVKIKDLAVFNRQLSTMVSAGIPLNRALDTLKEQTKNKYFKEVISGVSKDVQGGLPLADAFAKYPRVFSDVYVNMVKAGEAGGILDEILKRLAIQIESDSSMKKRIRSAMAYPVVILTVTIFAFFGIMIFIIPKIGAIIKDLGGGENSLPIYTRVMLGVSDFFVSGSIIAHIPIFNMIPGVNRMPNAVFILVGSLIAAFFIRRYVRTPAGKLKFHALLLRIPVVNTVIIKLSIARFARTFASLMSSGVGVLDALDVTGGSIGNLVIENELKEAAKEVKNGKQLSEPLSKSKHFPPIVAQMLAVGEESGKIDTILIKVADFYEEDVETAIDGLASVIEPIMIILLGSVVGIIAASVMGPIAGLSKSVGNQ